MASTSEIIVSYKTFLEVKYPSHFVRFCIHLEDNPESAKAEAVVFSLMRSIFHDVKIGEDISTGGADFLCTLKNVQFITEVTCLEAESVANQSGWKNKVPKDGAAEWFGMITHKLRTKVSSKARQVSGYAFPRLLAITSEHIGADFLLGPHGAETLLTSDTQIEVPLGRPIDSTNLVTDLKNSVFFRIKNGSLEPCRRSISAILLISIYADKSLIVGILHPDPEENFPMDLLPSVPFLRIKKWPPENNQIETEWVIPRPAPAELYHRIVEFKDEELKSIYQGTAQKDAPPLSSPLANKS